MLVLVGAAVVGRHRSGWVQAVGVVLVGAGISSSAGCAGDADRARSRCSRSRSAPSIAGYTLVDKEGIEHASRDRVPRARPRARRRRSRSRGTSSRGRVQRVRAEIGWTTVGAVGRSRSRRTRSFSRLSTLAPAPAVAAVRETSMLFAVALGAIVLRRAASARPRVVGRRRSSSLGVALVALGLTRRGRRGERGAILAAPHFTGFTKWARRAHFC